MKKALCIAVAIMAVCLRVSVVTNGNDYYINDTAKRAIVLETRWTNPTNPEPIFLIVIE